MQAVISAVGSVLGGIMGACYSLVRDYGLSIILFTLGSKVILLPVSIWTHRNGLKVVKMQPEINRLKVRFYGDPDTIAEKQAALYKKEKYNPLASLIPLAIQIVILMGVIEVINHPLEHLVRGGTAEGFSTWFAGLDLSWVPARQGPVFLLVPLAAGASALFLAVMQNRMNPLQHEQSRGMQWGTLAFSVGISLYLGYYVPVGVALYWIASNLMTVVQQMILNRLIDPRKVVDYQALEESRKELESLSRLGKEGGKKEDRVLRKREKEDYSRFFSVTNKHLVFYSESNGFYKYFGPILDEIFRRSNVIVHYITSDPEDGIFELAEQNPRLKAYYIGPRRLITLMMKMDADVVVMTMSDLDNYHYKRSYVRKDIRYVYLFHYPLSTHMVLHTGALDHYDEILCVGAFQIPEIRKSEELAGLPEKQLEVCGYCQLDSLYKAWLETDRQAGICTRVLIAPSWQEDNILDTCLDELLHGLLGQGWQVTVRPHPEYMKRYGPRMDGIIGRWKDYDGGDLFFETDFSSNESIYASDVVITDWSGTAAEFSFITLRPCIFVNTPPKVNNPDYIRLGIEPQELRLRSLIGIPMEMRDAGKAGENVRKLLEHPAEWTDRIRKVRDELIANFPDSAPVSAQAILNAVVDQQDHRRKKGGNPQ